MKKIKKKTFISLVLFVFTFLLLSGSVFAQYVSPDHPAGLPSSLEDAGISVTNWLLGFVVLLAILALVWGGVQYVFSTGDEEKVRTGKRTVTYAIIGLIIAGSSYAMVKVVVEDSMMGGGGHYSFVNGWKAFGCGEGCAPNERRFVNFSCPEGEICPDEKCEYDSVCDGIALPVSFDWRNESGENWMTAVKNQGACGSCWAFSALGSIEAKYNIEQNNAGLDKDISEQYLVSSCFPWGCSGGSQAEAMRYIKDSGITDEDCYPYSGLSSSCSGRCADWNSRLWKVGGYAYIDVISAGSDAIKSFIVNKGPLTGIVHIGGAGNGFDGGIYKCTGDDSIDGDHGHGIVLVGYNDTGSYWIVKNSWGTGWPPPPDPNYGGYYRVGYGECSIEENIFYSEGIISP